MGTPFPVNVMFNSKVIKNLLLEELFTDFIDMYIMLYIDRPWITPCHVQWWSKTSSSKIIQHKAYKYYANTKVVDLVLLLTRIWPHSLLRPVVMLFRHTTVRKPAKRYVHEIASSTIRQILHGQEKK